MPKHRRPIAEVRSSPPPPREPIAAGTAKPRPRPAVAGPIDEEFRVEARIFGRTIAAPDAVVAALAAFLGSRLLIVLLGTAMVGLLPTDKKPASLLQALAAWDGGWYLDIATSGYVWKGAAVQSNVVFFPLFPLLGRIVGFFDARWGLFLVANLAFYAYLYYLYRLTRAELGTAAAGRTIAYAAVFPVAFVLSSLYTESLSFALVVASIYYARVRRNWPVALALGAGAALTRLAGVLVVLPLAYELVRQRGWRPSIAVLGVVPGATALFALYTATISGSLLAFVDNRAWDRTFTWTWNSLGIAWDLLSLPPSRYIAAIAIVDIFALLILSALAILAIRLLPPLYWLYAVPVLILVTTTTLDPARGLPTASWARYLMAAFPAFMVLGLLGRYRIVHDLVLFTSCGLLGILTLYFFAGVWVT
ncbi:MAG: hypothetical protein HY331_06390 [Chloroflexi bacterium]|nr:hypothetical protein [Chloroflexota bacterium]